MTRLKELLYILMSDVKYDNNCDQYFRSDYVLHSRRYKNGIYNVQII